MTDITRVRGFCPMGCVVATLRVAANGRVYCTNPQCPRPFAAAEILEETETEHVVRLRAGDFTIKHPLRERLEGEPAGADAGGLFDCPLAASLEACSGPPHRLGDYRVFRDDDGWRWQPL